VALRFSYADEFGAAPSTGYETLLLDALLGEATLFQRADMVESGWRVVQPIQQRWAEDPDGPERYAAGSWGPAAADELLARSGRGWRTPA
jgi:glucose-6-phosphate 1-dehydrogenase